ncbi:MAG: hypothetical protein M3R24_31645 [Chloroflexota bacterium]|nr:hypothetical protein [Chloroflexota bacterium]
MVTNVPPLRLDGLDAHALQFINQYFPPVCAFLVRHFPDEFPADQLLLPKSPGKPWQPFLELERRVTRADARFGDERARGRRSWENDYLLPLAAELDLPSLLAERFLSTCWSNGLFDRPVGKVKQRVRPPYEIIGRASGPCLRRQRRARTAQRPYARLLGCAEMNLPRSAFFMGGSPCQGKSSARHGA